MQQSCWVSAFDENHDRKKLKSGRISPVLRTNLCWAKILNYQSQDGHKWCTITATMRFPTTIVSTINPTIVCS